MSSRASQQIFLQRIHGARRSAAPAKDVRRSAVVAFIAQAKQKFARRAIRIRGVERWTCVG